MTYKIPDELENGKPSRNVCVDSNKVRGFAIVTSVPERDAISEDLRKIFGAVIVAGQLYIYNGPDITDPEWINSSNWQSSGVGGGTWGSITGILSDQTDLQSALDSKVDDSEKGSANGIATLDASSKLPSSELTEDAMQYKGNWDASTNTPALSDGTGSTGDVYRVTVAGAQDLGSGSITFEIGDKVVYNGATWEKWAEGGASVVIPGNNGEILRSDGSGDVTVDAFLSFINQLLLVEGGLKVKNKDGANNTLLQLTDLSENARLDFFSLGYLRLSEILFSESAEPSYVQLYRDAIDGHFKSNTSERGEEWLDVDKLEKQRDVSVNPKFNGQAITYDELSQLYVGVPTITDNSELTYTDIDIDAGGQLLDNLEKGYIIVGIILNNENGTGGVTNLEFETSAGLGDIADTIDGTNPINVGLGVKDIFVPIQHINSPLDSSNNITILYTGTFAAGAKLSITTIRKKYTNG